MTRFEAFRGAARAALAWGPLTIALSGCGVRPADDAPPLETVAQMDLERYMGVWYEIAKYPTRFEEGCAGVTAEYTLQPDGRVRVLNICRTADGENVASQIEGFATVADPSTNAKLTVYFFPPFGAPYWILELDEEYQHAVVGDPSRTFLWILSRMPTMEPQTYEAILQRLPEKGYDPTRLELTPQFPEKAP